MTSATPKAYNVVYDPEIGLQYEYPTGYIAVPSAGGMPGGVDKQVQYNNVGDFGGSPEFIWDETTRTLSLNSLTTSTTANLISAANSFINLSAAGTAAVIGYAQDGITLRGDLVFGASVTALNSSNDMTLNVPAAHTFAVNVDALSILADTNGVAIGTGGSHDPSAILDLQTTTQGFLFPRMSTTDRDAIVNPAESLTIYNLTTHTLNYWNGSAWTAV